MKLYGYTRVTALPTSPDVGQIVFLSPDGLTGTLQHWDGSAWVLVGGTPQLLSVVGSQLTLSGGGGSVTLPDLDNQSLSITGNVISLTSGGSVTLPTAAAPTLSIVGSDLSISGGNTITLPDLDSQTLSISGNVISLTSGGSVTLPAETPQTLSISGDVVTLTGGGSITLPTFSWREVVNSTIIAPMDVANGIAVSNTSATTVTIPLNSAVPIAVGSSVLVAADDVGTVTLVPAGGVTLHVGNGLSTTLLGQYSVVTLIKRSTDVWYAAGDFATP